MENDAPVAEIVAVDGGAKRRQILDGARKVFLRQGFDGASMNDVASAAGVSKGTLYVYFSSKEDLFEILIREERRQQAERMTDFSHQPGELRDVLHNFGRQLLDHMTQPDAVAQVRIVIAASAKFPQLGRAFFESGPLYGATRLAAYLREREAAGKLAMPDADRAAWQYLELCQAGLFKRLLFRQVDSLDAGEVEATVRAAVALFMAAYGTPPRSA